MHPRHLTNNLDGRMYSRHLTNKWDGKDDIYCMQSYILAIWLKSQMARMTYLVCSHASLPSDQQLRWQGWHILYAIMHPCHLTNKWDGEDAMSHMQPCLPSHLTRWGSTAPCQLVASMSWGLTLRWSHHGCTTSSPPTPLDPLKLPDPTWMNGREEDHGILCSAGWSHPIQVPGRGLLVLHRRLQNNCSYGLDLMKRCP